MNSLAKSIFISIVFFGQLHGSPAPQHFVASMNRGRGLSSATAISGGSSGATFVSLDHELGNKMNEALEKHMHSVFKKTDEDIARAMANSENFARRLREDIQASVQKSMADTHASIARSLASAGIGIFPPAPAKPAPKYQPSPANPRGSGFENLFGVGDSFAKNLHADISKTIADSQAQSKKFQADLHKITNEALQKAAKEGKLKVISTAAGGGPLSYVSSSVNGQGIVLTGSGGQPGSVVRVVSHSTDGRDPNVRVFSNVPIHVSGGNPRAGVGNGQTLQYAPSRQKFFRRAAIPRGNVRDNIIEREK